MLITAGTPLEIFSQKKGNCCFTTNCQLFRFMLTQSLQRRNGFNSNLLPIQAFRNKYNQAYALLRTLLLRAG